MTIVIINVNPPRKTGVTSKVLIIPVEISFKTARCEMVV